MDLGRTEIARFLSLREPFALLAPDELHEMAGHTELEFHLGGSAILTEDGGPVTFLRVIQAGAVSIVHDDHLLDLLGAGDSFGHDAMLAGMAPGYEARAAQDTLCYRIPVAAARPLLERARTRRLAVSARDPGAQPVAGLIRSPTVLCTPGETVTTVARRMTELGAGAAIVECDTGRQAGGGGAAAGHDTGRRLGIVTDQDLRTRVVAAGLSAELPVAEIMSTPVFTVTPDRLGAEVLFELLERGIHHAPVVTTAGRVVGLIEDSDLFAVRQRSWFGVRRAIAGATDDASLAAAAAQIAPIMLELHRASVTAFEVARVLSALTDALVVRALELAAGETQASDGGLVWVALGTHARRELTPASMPFGALICEQRPPSEWIAALSRTFAAGGLPAAVMSRTPSQWRDAACVDVRATAVLTDRRPLYGTPGESLPTVTGSEREALLALLAEGASRRAPTGFDDNAVLGVAEPASEQVDIHAAAVAPIQAIALWVGAAAGESGGSTTERLAAGAGAGLIDDAGARALGDAFAVAFELRMAHQMQQIAAGRQPDDRIAAAELSGFARNQLREVFRTIAAVQRRLAG